MLESLLSAPRSKYFADFVAIILSIPKFEGINQTVIMDVLAKESAPSEMIGMAIINSLKVLRKLSEIEPLQKSLGNSLKTANIR